MKERDHMKAKRSGILKRFRSRRVLIPLLAAVAVVFIGLGGYKGIANFAMDEMTGFLVGTGARADQHLQVQASAPRLESSGGAATQAAAVTQPATENRPEPGRVATLPRPAARTEPVTLLAQAALSEPAAAATRTPAVVRDSTAYRRNMKAYTASFLRDPFYSLVKEGKERPGKLLDIGRAKMVGSVWGESGIIALLEDDIGRSYALKVGDKVVNGRVISVTPASVTFTITVFGLTKSVTLELAEEGE
jgi:hypothetical protein